MIDYQMKAFELTGTVRQVRGKYEALMADVVTKVKGGKPVFFYAWSPSWVTNALVPGSDVLWLPTPKDALPPDIPNDGSALVKDVEAAPAMPTRAVWPWARGTTTRWRTSSSSPTTRRSGN